MSHAMPACVRLPGLSAADSLELGEYLDDGSVTFENEPIPEGDFGDLSLVTAIVVLSFPALKGLVSYLAYRHRGISFEQVVEVEPELLRRTLPPDCLPAFLHEATHPW